VNSMSTYPVIGVDGSVEHVLYLPGNDLDIAEIHRTVGSPFSHVILHADADGTYIGAFIRDEGLFDGSVPNVVMCCAGLAICGPVMLLGRPTPGGKCRPPQDNIIVQTMLTAASIYHQALDDIEEHRKNPFTIEIIDVDELSARLRASTGGADDANDD
jgi:hypothetical protein